MNAIHTFILQFCYLIGLIKLNGCWKKKNLQQIKKIKKENQHFRKNQVSKEKGGRKGDE